MRKIGTDRYTQVFVLDEPNEKSKACHEYKIFRSGAYDDGKLPASGEELSVIHFQKGPIKEGGINGVHNEDLLYIVLDRLNGFQQSEFKCLVNSIAITKIEEALLWLDKRTQDRTARGIEGTHTV